ncbi:Hydrogenase 4, component C or formate hydrogen lyase subunit 4 [Thermococcus paralvinellae]|uniref:Hydrogenase 4, component C or formate hydrogen lyase subunit 4 n=2 Tax=Thermococcus paralvinellae TaxID=582419 RepID=W0I460_9EURY|nr:Hydrogenase 4, component C or formate hydrogen lyase subunit 4 [Thermococcus paralvinellae]
MDYVSLIAAPIVIFLLPPLLDGIGRKIKARIQYRRGPPIMQTFYDLEKLLKLPSVLPTDSPIFRLAPYIALAFAITGGLMLPFGSEPVLAFGKSLIVFFYVMAMVSVVMILATFSVQNAFSHIGGHREVMLILSIEPVLAVVFGVLAFKLGTLNVAKMPFSASLSLSVVLAYILLAYAVYVEGGFVPFDIAEAETEIIGGPLTEYSGRLLGIFKYSLLIKRIVLLWLLSSLVTIPALDFLGITSSIVLFIAQLVMAFLLYSLAVVLEAANARLRIDQAVSLNKKVFLLSLVVLLIALVGW